MIRACGEDCQERHCEVCSRRHLQPSESITCPWCQGRVRADLAAIVELAAMLEDQAINGGGTTFEPIGRPGPGSRIPGGDAMVMLAGGSDGKSAVLDIMAGGTGSWSEDERRNDPTPPAWALARVEDDWRRGLGVPAATETNLVKAAGWLNTHLGWAAQHRPGFVDDAAELASVRARLEQVVGAGERPSVAQVPCFECGGQLQRAFAPPAPCRHVPVAAAARPREPISGSGVGGWTSPFVLPPQRAAVDDADDDEVVPPVWVPCGCDQGGLTSTWECRRCGRAYSDPEYLLAVRARLEEAS